MKLDGHVISIIIQTKEQYEGGLSKGVVCSVPLKGIPPYNDNPSSEKYNVHLVESIIQAHIKTMIAKILERISVQYTERGKL